MINTGATPEDIAKEFTNTLNQAIKAQEEQKKEDAKVKEMLSDAQYVADVFNKFTNKWYGDIAGHDITAEEILDVYELIAGLNIKVHKIKDTISSPSDIDVDGILDNFLSMLGL
jgi:GTP cyclohydrolase III